MEEFLSVNSGLPSRIPNTCDFEDYTADEIIQIGLLGLKNQGYFVDVDYYSKTIEYLYNKINDCSMVAGLEISMKKSLRTYQLEYLVRT